MEISINQQLIDLGLVRALEEIVIEDSISESDIDPGIHSVGTKKNDLTNNTRSNLELGQEAIPDFHKPDASVIFMFL